MNDITPSARKIAVLADEANKYHAAKQALVERLKKAKESEKQKILAGKQEKEILRQYNLYILHLLNEMKKNASEISENIKVESRVDAKETPKTPAENIEIKKAAKHPEAPAKTAASKLSVDIDADTFRRFIKSRKKKKKDIVVIKDYSLYEQSDYGKLANAQVGNLGQKMIKKYPELFEPLFKSMKSSDFQILSNTYVSIIIFSSILAFFPFFAFSLVFLKSFIAIRILAALIIGIVFSGLTFAILYFYPSMITSSRSRYMEAELPFVVVHMAAVAGSGAHPIAMFNLVLSSGEYKALESEIKKIINYVNLFGYNLTTALRLVAATTPLKEFRELLNGIVTTVETGGNLKEYLNIKATESMERYETKRQKYIQNLATFSDIYIGISLVAPMLLFLLLSLINSPFLGGTIGGLGAGTIAVFGTYIAIPLMNIAFLIVLSTITPK